MRKFILESHLALLLAILGICIVSLFIITACHKMDQKDDLVVAESTAYQKFFTVPVSTNLVVKAIIQSIKHQDEQAMFIEELAKKAGYAIWDRAFVTSEISAINSRLNGEGTNLGELVYIPFVKENEEYTNAILIVKILGVDTSYRLFYGSSYASLGFGTVQRGSWNATDLFHTFMTFDNAMFGYNGFIVKDKRLIPSLYLSGDTTGETRIQLQGTDQNFKLVAGISCHPIEVCGECLAFKTQSSSQLYRCCNPTIQNYCTTYWYDDGSGNISSPIGGGSTGGWQNPCRPIPGISDPCSGNGGNNGPPGWVPVEEENVPFGAENFDTWGVSSEDQVKINSWRANNIDTSGLDSCRREILRKLIGRLGTSPIGILLTKLDNAIGRPNTIDKFYVHFLTRPLANDNAFTEHATYDDINHEFEIDIVLDSTTAKTATELFIANALIHELVHAYMVYIWRKAQQSATQAQIDSLKYTQVFNTYVDTLLSKDSLNTNIINLVSAAYQHNYMADHLIEFMAEILKNFDNNRIADKRYYWYMAWSGLIRPQVKTWKLHWPNFSNWPPSNPAPSEDSTRGLKYALTLSRIDSIYNKVLDNEAHSKQDAKGRKPVPGGCY